MELINNNSLFVLEEGIFQHVKFKINQCNQNMFFTGVNLFSSEICFCNKSLVNIFCIFRHPHDKELRSPGKDLYWFQYYLLGNTKFLFKKNYICSLL